MGIWGGMAMGLGIKLLSNSLRKERLMKGLFWFINYFVRQFVLIVMINRALGTCYSYWHWRLCWEKF